MSEINFKNKKIYIILMHFQEKKKHFKKQHLPPTQIPLRTIWNCIPNSVFLNFELFCFCLKIDFFMILDRFDILMSKIIF
jgi:hypothetical protein